MMLLTQNVKKADIQKTKGVAHKNGDVDSTYKRTLMPSDLC